MARALNCCVRPICNYAGLCSSIGISLQHAECAFLCSLQLPDEHEHFSQRAPWLRASVLGANDGLVSVASLMLGVGGGSESLHIVVLAGVAGLIGGALSMAVGEYISVSSQRCAVQCSLAHLCNVACCFVWAACFIAARGGWRVHFCVSGALQLPRWQGRFLDVFATALRR